MYKQWEWHKEWYGERTGKDRITIEGVPSKRLNTKMCPYCKRYEIYKNRFGEMCIYCSDGYYKDFI
jgi:hypothetical protein